ncbi:hypothetical protein [Achromobacter sp. 2789STDY5608615]|uniref:PDC sensor domain-containing protein n=1 Tax=Achromobacter sp. 2789STDY5608615 TaxID=1806492 RepID=UPI001E2EF7AE|nr:hypothetical protein [Achromobacter sp. 2789STDY5608615]
MALLWMDRRTTWNQAYVSASNLSEALSADISRTIRVYDLSLQGVIERLHEPGIETLPRATLHRFLFDRAASAEYLGTILILDQHGNIRYDSQSLLPPDVNFADRDFFQVHREQADAGMYISRPYQSRLRGGATRASASAAGSPTRTAASPVWSPVPCAWPISASASPDCPSARATPSRFSATTARSSRARRIPRVTWATTSATPWIFSNS